MTMEKININPLFYIKPTVKARSEREELVQKYLDKINNSERQKMGFKDVSPIRFNMMAKQNGMRLSDLYYFYKKCDESRNFSECFFGHMKKRNK